MKKERLDRRAETSPGKRPLLVGANSITPWNQYRFNRADYTIATEELNMFYQFESSSLHREYLLYNLKTKSYSSVIFIVTVVTLILLPIRVLAIIYYPATDKNANTAYLVVNILMLFSLLIICFTGLLYILERSFPKRKLFKQFYHALLRLRKKYASIHVFGEESPSNTYLVENNEEDASFFHSNFNDEGSSLNAYGPLQHAMVLSQQIFIGSAMIFLLLYFINTCIQVNCTDYGNEYLNGLLRSCLNHHSTAFDQINSYPFLLMLSPILVACIFRETIFAVQCLFHFSVMTIAIVFVVVFEYQTLSLLILLVWLVGGFTILIDLHLHNVAAFLTSYQLRQILLEKERNADRTAATEMRHMIGNVAHDLKTPLSSFTTGLEIIADIIETNENMIQALQEKHLSGSVPLTQSLSALSKSSFPSRKEQITERISDSAEGSSSQISSPIGPSLTTMNPDATVTTPPTVKTDSSTPVTPLGVASFVEGLRENTQGIKQCLQNIRDTNTFMLMTINRCIDYTKASRGFKLIPKYETVELLETLHLPLDCMKNIQERIQINLKPWAENREQEICSHIITDKQWLQENILCLLSNAVKYSTEGEVTIAVQLMKNEMFTAAAPLPAREEVTEGTSAIASTGGSAAAGIDASRSDRKYSSLLSRSSITDRLRHQFSFSGLLFSTSHLPSSRSGGGSVSSANHQRRDSTSTHTAISEIGRNHSGPIAQSSYSNLLKTTTAAGSGGAGDGGAGGSDPTADHSLAPIGSKSASSKFPEEPRKRGRLSSFSSAVTPRSSKIEAGKDLAEQERTKSPQRNKPPNVTRESITPPKYSIATHYLRFEVEDTGIGMSAEAMSQLFSPFRQAQRLAGGTGLGLYSLAKRVEALNGAYGVSKRPDGQKGSLFWFSIPYRPDYTTADLLHHQYQQQQQLKNSISPIGEGEEEKNDSESLPQTCGLETVAIPLPPRPQLRRRNTMELNSLENKQLPSLSILLVDDSPSIIKMSSMMLKRQGHRLQTAENGEIALYRLREQWKKCGEGFDIILMDLQMPVMDGLEATRRLRKLEMIESEAWKEIVKEQQQQHQQQELTEIPSASESVGKSSPASETGTKTSQQHSERSSSSSSGNTTTNRDVTATSKSRYACKRWLEQYSVSQYYHHAVIGVSANSDNETANEALAAGFDAFLPKPFSMDLFHATVVKVLTRIQEQYEARQYQR